MASDTSTTLWKGPQGYTYGKIYLSVDNGEWNEFARGGDGNQLKTIKTSGSQTFPPDEG